VRTAAMLHTMLAIEGVVVEGVDWATDPGRDAAILLVSVRPRGRASSRCPCCGFAARAMTTPAEPRRWRRLDMGTPAPGWPDERMLTCGGVCPPLPGRTH